MQTVTKQIREAVDGLADSVGRKRDGQFVVRRSFFYSHGRSAGDFAADVEVALRKAKVPASVTDYGQHDAAFNGGAPIAKGTHWWATVRVAGGAR